MTKLQKQLSVAVAVLSLSLSLFVSLTTRTAVITLGTTDQTTSCGTVVKISTNLAFAQTDTCQAPNLQQIPQIPTDQTLRLLHSLSGRHRYHAGAIVSPRPRESIPSSIFYTCDQFGAFGVVGALEIIRTGGSSAAWSSLILAQHIFFADSLPNLLTTW